MRKVGLVFGWVLMTLFVTGMTWQIVSAAESQVSDGPITGISVDVTSQPDVTVVDGGTVDTGSNQSTTSSTSTSSPSTTQPGISPSTTRPTNGSGGTSGTTPSNSSPTTTQPSGSSNTTTVTSPSSTATTTSVQWTVTSIPTVGGTVVVAHRPGEVVLQAASPAPGFSVEVDKAGPPEVRVDFVGVQTDVEVRVRWNNGLLDIEIK